MKVLFLGSLITQESMEQFNNLSKEKASVAPVNYETMLVKGLVENGIEVEALSVPAVAAFPNSKVKFVKRTTRTLDNGVVINWVPFINVQGLKQMSIKQSSKKMIKKWLKDNRDVKDKLVLMYSIYPPYTAPAVELCKREGCHLSTIITDLPEYMYSWKRSKGIKGMFANHLQEQMLELQDKEDSYILFTEKMAKRMGVDNKPYMVSEGFSDESVYSGIEPQEKYEKKTIVYGGNLSKLYGIRALLDGFMQTKGDYELHLYGAGADSQYAKECAEKDSRVKFFGRVSRNEMLVALKKAHLLIVNKPTSDDYSNYSFSSKILEYMTSGTPVLTTRVGGMKAEYYDYFYFIEDETPVGISKAIEENLSRSENELNEMGKMAYTFATQQKNYNHQCKKIVDFLNDVNRKGDVR